MRELCHNMRHISLPPRQLCFPPSREQLVKGGGYVRECVIWISYDWGTRVHVNGLSQGRTDDSGKR